MARKKIKPISTEELTQTVLKKQKRPHSGDSAKNDEGAADGEIVYSDHGATNDHESAEDDNVTNNGNDNVNVNGNDDYNNNNENENEDDIADDDLNANEGEDEGEVAERNLDDQDQDQDQDFDGEIEDTVESELDHIKYVLKLLDKQRIRELADLKRTLPSEVRKLRKLTNIKEKSQDQVVEMLSTQNQRLKNRIIKLRKANSILKNQVKDLEYYNKRDKGRFEKILTNTKVTEDELESQILMYRNKLTSKEVFESQLLKVDIFELLSGINILELTENPQHDKLIVSLKQLGKAEFYYKLEIEKSDPNNKLVPSVFYTPLLGDNAPSGFFGNWSENVEILKQQLPDYLLENLEFPYNTLSMFYKKINDSLN